MVKEMAISSMGCATSVEKVATKHFSATVVVVAAEEVVEVAEEAEVAVVAGSMDYATIAARRAIERQIAGKMRLMQARGQAIGQVVRQMNRQWLPPTVQSSCA